MVETSGTVIIVHHNPEKESSFITGKKQVGWYKTLWRRRPGYTYKIELIKMSEEITKY